MSSKKMKKGKKNTAVPYKVPLMKNAFIEEKSVRAKLSQFVLTAPRLSMDLQCAQFEKTFAKKQGRKYAILFNSGGSANLAMIQALKNLGALKDNDKVGFSAVTWSTNVMPILQMGLGAVPIDCDPTTLNSMSHCALPRLEQEKCKAFFITNVLGFSGDLDVIEKECAKKGIIVLEDNCESLGTVLHTGKTGNFSLASSFSFFVAHHMSTIEGGMVCTDDHDFAEMLKIVRANGWDRNLHPKRQKHWRKKHEVESSFHAKYTFYDLGFNLRPTEITGFIGLNQLPHLDKTIKIREKNFKKIYAQILKNDDFLKISHDHLKTISAFAIPFICKTPELRKKYIKIFNDAGVEIRPMIAGNMQKQPFSKKYTSKTFDLPGADVLHDNAFYCGNCPDYTPAEIEIILNCIIKGK
ncbi:MAG TPA: DegT/DnrJ/EryC1/StrS family aminotransferase [Candidatus Paceibacterota bacterium]|nr:DegT/DnrJ/EryC1/StrS family aminotransferase [Candidatus Paceibacterota bacterium]